MKDNINYLSTEIVELAKSVGFDDIIQHQVPKGINTDDIPTHEYGYTIEQVEKFLFEKHEIVLDSETFFTPTISSVNGWKNDNWLFETASNNPFTAREQGVRQALEYIAKNLKEKV